MIVLLLLILFCKQATSHCVLRFHFAEICIHYDYSNTRCVPGLERETCLALFETYNDFLCPQYTCVSWFAMCYSRESFCKCCFTYIKVLTINKCNSKELICPKKLIFPKLKQVCEDCQQCKFNCSEIVRPPHRWKQPSSFYIFRITFATSSKQFELDIQSESKFTN